MYIYPPPFLLFLLVFLGVLCGCSISRVGCFSGSKFLFCNKFFEKCEIAGGRPPPLCGKNCSIQFLSILIYSKSHYFYYSSKLILNSSLKLPHASSSVDKLAFAEDTITSRIVTVSSSPRLPSKVLFRFIAN